MREFEQKPTYFCTFGSSHLQDFKVAHPMRVIVVGFASEIELRMDLCEVLGNNRFSTSYPYDKYIDEFYSYGDISEITCDELRLLKAD